MDKKKNGNIFKSSQYSASTVFDDKYNTILKAAEAYRPKKDKGKDK